MFTGLSVHVDLRERLVKANGINNFRDIVFEMVERRKDVNIQDKLGWYLRYWKEKPKHNYLKGISVPQEKEEKEEEKIVEDTVKEEVVNEEKK